MGRISPRRRKTTRVYQPLLRTWLNFSQRLKPGSAPEAVEDPESEQPPEKGKGQNIKALLLKIWHLPDGFGWMEPLPYFHRRWTLIFGIILLLALLWPYSSENSGQPFPVTQQDNSVPLRADLQNDAQQQHAPEAEPAGNWQRYQIQPGQTLAQLFRDNSLPVNEVFAMAQVEGNDKPLSNMKAGQEVRIERDTNGVITALSVTTADNSQVLFRRQADGSYRRER
ncbi:MAG: OapA family protein [Serratia proteamaculans]|jgi:cell envelope opacity-associated protein A|uniref:Opacity-associated protein A domain protein n=1 Tax=Serratia proteamaculans TaxID=28151 RepID=A0ABS0TTG1_SERPR|nr:LysM-like peptidoglycan-binding domain-containing protein [Serratia proteamaculans]SPZ53009.1 Opacity-associated protein A LysM-like domain [Serratia quinivorans]KAB1495996.1 Opacity-associated protein A domain protein [Serratia proteamaculans]MBI6181641.1 Opacity-associated protein A domain protein [Serratia proteamaculans]NWA72945.1 Opacity-associated protein A domain protein [Serratia proteamaculans]RYM53970.1 Opacity-associated protein A domain protein [Serratia proteamaculans]